MNVFILSAKGTAREVYIKKLLEFLKVNKRLGLSGFYQ